MENLCRKNNIILKDETCDVDFIPLTTKYYVSFKNQGNNLYKAEFKFNEEDDIYKKLLSFMHRAVYCDNKIYLKEKQEYLVVESYINKLEQFNKKENLVTMLLVKMAG